MSWGGIDHQQEALLGGRKLWVIVIRMSSPDVLLHRPKSFLLLWSAWVSVLHSGRGSKLAFHMPQAKLMYHSPPNSVSDSWSHLDL